MALAFIGPPTLAQTVLGSIEPTRTETASLAQTILATGPWTKSGGLPSVALTGNVQKQSWQVPDEGRSTLQLITQLLAETEAAGFERVFACEDAACGGFDFRFAIPVLAEPDMHVDLGDFQYALATRPSSAGPEYKAILVSRGPGVLYAQITLARPGAATDVPAEPTAKPEETPDLALPDVATPTPIQPQIADGSLISQLLSKGGAALDDLVFAPAAAELLAGDYASLQELGAWLLANPQVSVAFVGHSDSTGGLDGNIALSKRRAQSVRDWVQERFDLPQGQISAEGVGYLAPRASNSSAEGQARNRRVEVMITSTP